MLPALWIFSAVPGRRSRCGNVLTSAAGVGASPTIATRLPWPEQAGCLQRRDPVGGQDLVGNSPDPKVRTPGRTC